jgi:hypothetical protein
VPVFQAPELETSMTTLMLQPFALRQGKLSCDLSLEEIHDTLARAHSVVLQASGSQVKMSWGPAFALDYPEGTFPTEVPATENSRMDVVAKLRRHEYLGRVSPTGLIRVFFVWAFASHFEGKTTVAPKGLTMNSHWLMILGAKASSRERYLSTAHEIGHALLGTRSGVHRSGEAEKDNLMFENTGGVGGKLDAVQRDFFVKNAARVAAGTNIVKTEFEYK